MVTPGSQFVASNSEMVRNSQGKFCWSELRRGEPCSGVLSELELNIN